MINIYPVATTILFLANMLKMREGTSKKTKMYSYYYMIKSDKYSFEKGIKRVKLYA